MHDYHETIIQDTQELILHIYLEKCSRYNKKHSEVIQPFSLPIVTEPGGVPFANCLSIRFGVKIRKGGIYTFQLHLYLKPQ